MCVRCKHSCETLQPQHAWHNLLRVLAASSHLAELQDDVLHVVLSDKLEVFDRRVGDTAVEVEAVRAKLRAAETCAIYEGQSCSCGL
jgi:hypothetical protein